MRKSKVYSLYLPQFHQTPENDEWWGEGFTEWNAVKNAKKLSRYSCQPKIPLNGYYDLSLVENIRKQAKLAIEHGIDGFAIYHYYSNGKKLLYKPAELLLQNKDIQISFFFSWANHDWKRTWYGYNMEMLLKQEYGNEEQIKEHFKYLLSFFKDERYLKIDNKPVLAIYRHSTIINFEKYYSIWNLMAKENGFNGIYFLQTLSTPKELFDNRYYNACFDFEPGYTINGKAFKSAFLLNRIRSKIVKKSNLPIVSQIYDFKAVSKIIRKRHNPINHFYGVFAGWDNTPRHKYMGAIYKNFNIQCFSNLFLEQYQKSCKEEKELLIINAWNEWSEGAFLEPDDEFKYLKLETIRNIIQASF